MYVITCLKNLHKFFATITVFAKSDKSHLLLCFMNSSVSSGQKVELYPWQEYFKVHPAFIISVHIHLSSPGNTTQKQIQCHLLIRFFIPANSIRPYKYFQMCKSIFVQMQHTS